jgi:hypothetical protein
MQPLEPDGGPYSGEIAQVLIRRISHLTPAMAAYIKEIANCAVCMNHREPYPHTDHRIPVVSVQRYEAVLAEVESLRLVAEKASAVCAELGNELARFWTKYVADLPAQALLDFEEAIIPKLASVGLGGFESPTDQSDPG